MVRRALLRLLKGFVGTFIAVFVSALIYAKESFVPSGEMATLIWKAIGIALFSGIIMALEKLKKMLNESRKGS